ncbi:hypothetical protein LPB140_05090 [Sphingorhabdus lutea]|uniref:DSBA-like thioredoxin domain-containing protein n=1 Tax=Sphingorhabdus lutea TaxID=1913578 RepID=A0A1L3JAY3_9SPHN|nr:DsbA family oxidoreductase [Sphingorhabdus lutea]APG62281.1 hypothetical protein LPB140_05090 [Sphingorhabdus lutea]
MTRKLRFDIVSDIVCPWCIIGYKQVEKAIAALNTAADEADKIQAEFYWHPFELNPNMPAGGENAAEHIARKYGRTVEQGRQARQALVDKGAALGFTFNYGDDMHVYNSFGGHKLIHWAGASFGPAAQTRMKLALFNAYFTEGKNIDDMDVLLATAMKAGFESEGARAALLDEEITRAVRAEQHMWRERDIQGVPAIIIAEKYMVPGAQDADVFQNIIKNILAKEAAA